MNPFLTGPASRDYTVTVAGWMVLYVVLLLGVSCAADRELLTATWIYPAAVLPAIPVGGVMWAVLRLMKRSDEYVRGVLAKTYVIAISVTLFLCVAYGFLEIYAGARHLALFWVFPVFWVLVAIIGRFVGTTR